MIVFQKIGVLFESSFKFLSLGRVKSVQNSNKITHAIDFANKFEELSQFSK
jgi:hypothetical protein